MSQSAQQPRFAMPSGSPGLGSGKGQLSRNALDMKGATNVFDQSAAGLGVAMDQTLNTMAYRPMSVSGFGYSPAMASTNQGQLSYDPAQLSSQYTSQSGYNPATVNPVSGYSADQVASGSYDAGQLANTNLDPYLNPYEDQVVDQSLSDIDRARQMASNQTDAQATAAGAFGGSRQAIMQAENNRNYLDQSARTSSQLRQSGFQNAQQAALRDIMGRDQANQFNLSQDLRAQLANQGANAQADQFNAGQAMQARLANMQAQNRASEFGRSQGMQGALANMQSQNQARAFGADAAFRGGLANQNASNQAAQFGLSQSMQAQLANQRARESAQRLMLGAGSQMGQLANLGFGMGQGANNQLAQQGSYRRGIEQSVLDSARGQFMRYTGQPQQNLGIFGQALGSTPYGQSQSYQPGLFDYLSLGASMVNPISL